jgi:hypothetical protein
MLRSVLRRAKGLKTEREASLPAASAVELERGAPREDGGMAAGSSTGVAVAREYFDALIQPTLTAALPGLRYGAGRFGTGSDVLGLDDETSRDHDWGLRLHLLVPEAAVAPVQRVLEQQVPAAFRGLPTRFALTGEAAPRLQVDVTSMAGFVEPLLGFDPRSGTTTADWLSLSGQAVLEATAGPVFLDADGEIERLRQALAWYPDDVWRYVLACDWRRIGQELPLMGRAADVGDHLGSSVIAARLTHVLMHLAFLLERRWPPYTKWFGTAFRMLRSAADLAPSLDQALGGADHGERERGVAAALQLLLSIQNAAGLTSVRRAAVPFWDRPFVHPDPAIAAQLMRAVTDDGIRAMPLGRGSIEQRTDNVDVLVDAAARRRATLDLPARRAGLEEKFPD